MDKDNRDTKDPEYPAELESQFILRLPPEPAKALKEVIKTGENLKNRLTIQFENDMRHGEVRFDQWHMHAKIVDLPTIVDSLKTIDNKNFYKTADIAQMMICKTDSEPTSTEEETPAKNKKKDPCKVDKKFLWPHGLTPPTKNIRKRRFRKTLRKKFVEAPEIEKEVKRLLRADNEAMSVTWEVINEDDDQQATLEPTPSTSYKPEKKTKGKAERVPKKEKASTAPKPESSNVVDIFGGALSDSDLEEENIQMEMANCRLSPYKLPEPVPGPSKPQVGQRSHTMEFQSETLSYPESPKPSTSQASTSGIPPSHFEIGGISSDDESDYQTMRDESKENMTFRINQVKTELDELKQRRQRTQHEIAGMENLALKQRFKDILHTLNQDIMFKDMEYQGLLTLQNSEVI